MTFTECLNSITKDEILTLQEDKTFKFCASQLSKYFNINDSMLKKILIHYSINVPKLTTNKKFTQIEWVEKANIKHNYRYDYSLVKYINGITKVKIICPDHGVFTQQPNVHSLRGDKCPECSLNIRADLNRTSREYFINKSNEVHNYKFDYSLVQDFKQLGEKLTIICPIHGVFYQNGHNHMKGSDCEKCSYEKRGVDYSIPKEEMLKRFETFGNGLVYDLTDYKNTNSRIKYVCSIHGELSQSASKHSKGKNCWKCNKAKVWNVSNTEEFIKKAIKVHGNYYDYSLSNYINNRKNVKIICKYHGVFEQRPNTHVEGAAGCPICAIITSNIKDYLNDIEDTKTIPCDVYIMMLTGGNGEQFYKIGISRYTKKREYGISADSNKFYKANTLYNYQTNLFNAAHVEQNLHEKYKNFKHKPKTYFKGHTECFTLDLPINKIIEELKKC